MPFIDVTVEKEFKYHSGLWRHKKNCIITNEDQDLIIKLLNENQEFKKIIIEQSKQMQEQTQIIKDLATKVGTTNTNSNNNNKTFNLHFFLHLLTF